MAKLKGYASFEYTGKSKARFRKKILDRLDEIKKVLQDETMTISFRIWIEDEHEGNK